MSIQDRIQDWLGITNLRVQLRSFESALNRVNNNINIITPGLGRVIAKLDAKYTESEFSAERKAESDKLAEEAIARLKAEAAARAPYNDPPDASGSYSSWKSGAYKP